MGPVAPPAACGCAENPPAASKECAATIVSGRPAYQQIIRGAIAPRPAYQLERRLPVAHPFVRRLGGLAQPPVAGLHASTESNRLLGSTE